MKYFKFVFLLYACVQFSYCNSKNGSSDKSEEANSLVANAKGPLNQENFRLALASLKNGELLDSVHLKNILPQNLINLNRVSLTSKKSDNQGTAMSRSGATYKKDDKSLNVTITDVGSDSTLIGRLAPWSAMEFQNITNIGFERSFILNGIKMNEKYDSTAQIARLSVIYYSRIVVDLIGSKTSNEDLRLTIK